jgi:hypothetical protein
MAELPPMPDGWNRTIKDLFEELSEGKRTEVSWPESGWAVEYERSLLPAGTRFPRGGEVYAAREPFRAGLIVLRRAPGDGPTYPFTLATGCRIRVDSRVGDRPMAVGAVPVDYEAIEKAAIPWWARWHPWYGGYYFVVSTLDLNERFTLVVP